MKPSKLRLFFVGQFILLICLFSLSPVYAIPAECVMGNAVFQLHFLNKQWRDYKLNSYENPSEVLLSEKIMDLKQESVFCITEKDIDLYNWPSQTIFLNQDFIHKLKKVLEEVKRAEKLKTKSEGGSAVFVLVFKGSRIYGGAIDASAATGYTVPTLFVSGPDERIIINIRPLKTGDAEMTGYFSLDDSLKKIIERSEIRDFFLKLGKLAHNDDPSCVKEWLPKKECDFDFVSKRRVR